MHILIIDDNESIRDGILRLLHHSHHVVSSAPSGELAIEHVKVNEVDLLITDHNMPNGMSGLEVIKVVKGMMPRVRLWLMSGFIQEHLIQEALKHGAEAAFDKIMIRQHLVLAKIIVD